MKINRIILKLILEINIILIMIVGTYFIWGKLDYGKEAQIAYAYSNYDARLTLNVTNEKKDLSFYDNDIILSIANSNSITKSYELYIKLENKDSLSNMQNLIINFGGNTFSINELESYVQGKYTYYKITKSSIKRKSKMEFNVKFFLEDNANTKQNKSLKLSFELKEI